MTRFAELTLCPELLAKLEALGYKEPTPIQAKAIPLILQGKDLLAEAQTGTGKTAAFALPILQTLQAPQRQDEYHLIRALILVPTRELAIQVADQTLAYAEYLGLRVVAIYGGVRFDNQLRKMKRGADVLVATPGRLLDMLLQKKISLQHLEHLVLDEADRMLDLGFIDEIGKILRFAPSQRQTLLFSATLNSRIDELAEVLLNDPQRLSTSTRNSASKQVQHYAYAVDAADKADILCYLIKGAVWQQTLVFTRTRKRADALTDYLNQEGIAARALHGDKIQKERTAALQAFLQNEIRVLVATDVAARGLHIDALPQVVNFDLPNIAEDYVHRVGRTGRAGQKGQAHSLVGPDEKRYLNDICALIGQNIPLRPVPQATQSGLQQATPIASAHPSARAGRRKQGSKSALSKPTSKLRNRTQASKPGAAVPSKSKKSATPTPTQPKAKPVKSRQPTDKGQRASIFDT